MSAPCRSAYTRRRLLRPARCATAPVAVLMLAVLGPARPAHSAVPPRAVIQQAAESSGAAASEPQTPLEGQALEERTREVASQLRCVVCQGLSIQDSPSELAQQMKDVVRQQLADGRTPDEVKAYFVERYGEWVLLSPEPTGVNLLVYALPWIALAVGVLVIVLAVWRWTRTGGGPETGAGVPEAVEEDDAGAHLSY